MDPTWRPADPLAVNAGSSRRSSIVQVICLRPVATWIVCTMRVAIERKHPSTRNTADVPPTHSLIFILVAVLYYTVLLYHVVITSSSKTVCSRGVLRTLYGPFYFYSQQVGITLVFVLTPRFCGPLSIVAVYKADSLFFFFTKSCDVTVYCKERICAK